MDFPRFVNREIHPFLRVSAKKAFANGKYRTIFITQDDYLQRRHILSADKITFSGLLRSSGAALRGNYWKAFASIVIVAIIEGGVSKFSGLGILLLPLQAGMMLFYLQVARGNSPRVDVIFHPFRKYSHYLWVMIRPGIFVLLWSLLLLIPGIIAALRYCLSSCIALDEPELSAKEVMEKSSRMMKGHKLELFGFGFLLSLLFFIIEAGALCIVLLVLWLIPGEVLRIGFLFVGLLACAVVFFVLLPWGGTFFASYYLAVKAENDAGAPAPDAEPPADVQVQ